MDAQRVLVAYATKMGSTEEIAEAIGRVLRSEGYDVDVLDVRDVKRVDGYRAVVVGSALYMGRWRREAVRFLRRHQRVLTDRRVWLFHGGPLDHEPDNAVQALPSKVQALADRIEVVDAATFGGKLDAETKGFVAKKIAAERAGDYRDFAVIEDWATGIARELTPAADAA